MLRVSKRNKYEKYLQHELQLQLQLQRLQRRQLKFVRFQINTPTHTTSARIIDYAYIYTALLYRYYTVPVSQSINLNIVCIQNPHRAYKKTNKKKEYNKNCNNCNAQGIETNIEVEIETETEVPVT